MKTIYYLGSFFLATHYAAAAVEDNQRKGPSDPPEPARSQGNVPPDRRDDEPTPLKNVPNATDRIISEAPATVVVKPTNPFSGFRKVDKNGDGSVSLVELTAAFQRADGNGDERLSLEEFQLDIIDQPIDAGGTPDEPRIIIQTNDPKKSPETALPSRINSKSPKANSGKSANQKNDGKNDRESTNDTGVDVDIAPGRTRETEEDQAERTSETDSDGRRDTDPTTGTESDNKNIEQSNGEEQSPSKSNNAEGTDKPGSGKKSNTRNPRPTTAKQDGSRP